MTDKDVEILDKTNLYRGYFRADRFRFRHRLHAGGWSATVEREVLERGHAAAVLPYDPDADAVVLIEQFRIGAYLAGLPAWQIEIVAGIIEPGETADQVAHREAKEEAGCTIVDLFPVSRYLTSPGAVTESILMFCGRVDSRGVGGIFGLAHEHEDIKVSVVPYADVQPLLDSGRVGNAVGLVALQWLLLNRDTLRRRWRNDAAAP